MVASAPPDGYTLILAGTGHALTESLYKKKPYDILKEFIPISKFAQTDIAMLAGKKSNYQNMQEFLRAAKENPGKLVVGIPLLGTGQHLTAEILKKSGKVDFLIVPYKTSGALHMALAQGEADLIVDQVPAVLGQIQAGEMRPLAIASSGRSPVLPDTPTLQELGLTKYEFASTGLIAAPAGTPAAIVAKINAGVKKTLEDPELQARFKRAGVVPVSSTPEESRAYFVNQLKSIGDTINLAKIPRQ